MQPAPHANQVHLAGAQRREAAHKYRYVPARPPSETLYPLFPSISRGNLQGKKFSDAQNTGRRLQAAARGTDSQRG